MRKILNLAVLIVLATATVAFASWGIASIIDSGPDDSAAQAAVTTSSVNAEGETGEGATEDVTGSAGQGETGDGTAGEGIIKAAWTDAVSGDWFDYEDPDQRYVTETQRHQNFFKALAEGTVARLDVTSTDFMPDGDSNTSYVYVIVTTTGGDKCDGRLVLKYEDNMWRIAGVRLSGALAGGTNYQVPASLEDTLAAELEGQQDFLQRVAEGKLKYMKVTNVDQTGETEALLTGEVCSKAGVVYATEMLLRKDYGIWHLVNSTHFEG